MAKNKAYTGKYDNNGNDDEDDVEVEAATVPFPGEVPAPGTAQAPIPAGLPPDQYMTAQEKHVADGGEYAPPPETEEEVTARHAKAAKEAEAEAKKAEAEAKKAKKEEK